jgi:8-oxo-dGTP diphosphatase
MMKKVIVVGAVIQDHQNRILCALRSSKMTLPNYWEFPGGKVELNENQPEALRREIDEELACEIEVGEKIIETTHDYSNITVHLHTYWCKIKKGVPTANEHAQLAWIPLNKLLDLKWAPADIPTIEKITHEKNLKTH